MDGKEEEKGELYGNTSFPCNYSWRKMCYLNADFSDGCILSLMDAKQTEKPEFNGECEICVCIVPI